MNKKIFIIFAIFILIIGVLPAWALDCNRKPCHSKCIKNQPTYIQNQCWCDARKKFIIITGELILVFQNIMQLVMVVMNNM